MARWLLALGLGSQPGGGVGLVYVDLVRRLLVYALHVSFLHASVIVALDLGDQVGVHGRCLF
jgi:hypothetical protein